MNFGKNYFAIKFKLKRMCMKQLKLEKKAVIIAQLGVVSTVISFSRLLSFFEQILMSVGLVMILGGILLYIKGSNASQSSEKEGCNRKNAIDK